MGKLPSISIISPVYNMEKYLRQSIQSVISQTFTDWELILVDDGSTDSSGEICDSYSASDPRIRVIHKKNGGQAESRNVGVEAARADLIGFVDSDDWIEPQMFEVLYNTLAENDADISICGHFKSYRNMERKSCKEDMTYIYTGEEALNKVIDDREIKSYLWDKLYRKSVITELMPNSFYYEDYSTLFKWFVNAKKVAFRTVPLYHYRQRSGSTDHDCDPVKKYHFFLAELERYNFLKSKKLLPERRREFAVKVVKIGVQEIKEIARKAGNCGAGSRYIDKIKTQIQPFLPVHFSELGAKKYFRLRMMQYSVPMYVSAMRLGRYVVNNQIFNNRVFYE